MHTDKTRVTLAHATNNKIRHTCINSKPDIITNKHAHQSCFFQFYHETIRMPLDTIVLGLVTMQHTYTAWVQHTSLITCLLVHGSIHACRHAQTLLMCISNNTCAHTNIHNPDTDDSLYPFSNQLYMSALSKERASEREKREMQQLLVCKQRQIIISCSGSLLLSYSHSLEY